MRLTSLYISGSRKICTSAKQQNYGENVAVAIRAANAAAEIIKRHFSNPDGYRISLKGNNDYLTDIDLACEETIISTIRSVFPKHHIIAEESGGQRSLYHPTWIIDPLDGTRNFIQGIPIVAVSIAFVDQGNIVAGVVADCLDESIYSATRYGGAFFNQQRIHVSAQEELEGAFFATGFPHRDKSRIKPFLAALDWCLHNTSGGRRLGAAALDLCWLACGRTDFYFEVGLGPWDVAAGALILEEAGGTISDFNGQNNYLFSQQVLASNGHLHATLLDQLPGQFSVHGR
jgi:myo-inositol-1(or 4)-monophosphatase